MLLFARGILWPVCQLLRGHWNSCLRLIVITKREYVASDNLFLDPWIPTFLVVRTKSIVIVILHVFHRPVAIVFEQVVLSMDSCRILILQLVLAVGLVSLAQPIVNVAIMVIVLIILVVDFVDDASIVLEATMSVLKVQG